MEFELTELVSSGAAWGLALGFSVWGLGLVLRAVLGPVTYGSNL